MWKAAKTSSYLRDSRLRFAEDLSREDRERRDKLWPMIDKARKEGKPAYFVGGRGFISGVEVFPSHKDAHSDLRNNIFVSLFVW